MSSPASLTFLRGSDLVCADPACQPQGLGTPRTRAPCIDRQRVISRPPRKPPRVALVGWPAKQRRGPGLVCRSPGDPGDGWATTRSRTRRERRCQTSGFVLQASYSKYRAREQNWTLRAHFHRCRIDQTQRWWGLRIEDSPGRGKGRSGPVGQPGGCCCGYMAAGVPLDAGVITHPVVS